MLTGKERELLEALEPRAAAEGVEVVTVEVVGARKAPTIRVYLDAGDGMSFDALASAQKWIDAVCDDLDPFPGAYTLEVSSPGIDRPLRTPAHFERFAGEDAVVKTTEPLDGRSSFTGAIVRVNGDAVVLSCESGEVAVPFASMKRAHLKGRVDFNAKRKDDQRG